MATRKFSAKIQADFLGGVRSGVNGTPSLFINGERYEGAVSYEWLVAAIEVRLRAIATG